MQFLNYQKGFTLIELIIVIVILGILSIVATPRFIDVSSSAKIAVMNNIAAQMKSTADMVRMKATIDGLRASSSNPGSRQSELIVDFGFGRSEVDWSNLCPESRAEMGDRMEMLDFLDVSFNDDITTRVNNQYTLVGFDIPASGIPLDSGCYVIYDSFARPNCTIKVVDIDC